MNLLNNKWKIKGNVKFNIKSDTMIIENKTDSHGFLIYPKLFKHKKDGRLLIDYKGKSINGTSPILRIINRHKKIMGESQINTKYIINFDVLKYYILVLYVPAHSKTMINKLEYDLATEKDEQKFLDFFVNDNLIITPNYPTDGNKYNTAFVHTRTKEYKKYGLKCDIIVVNSLPGKYIYNYEGINVLKADFFFLRNLLSNKKYKNIFVHFFNDTYANVFDSVDLTNSSLFLYLHGADVLYKDYEKYASPYFNREIENCPDKEEFSRKDYFFKKYNELANVKWMFVSDFVKNRAEELLNIKFKNYEIIPCVIDTDTFKFEEKDDSTKKKIFVLRRFSNDSCYAIDIDVQTILELSRRPIFNELEFDIYGDGEMFEVLTSPLKQFDNVHLNRTFLSHEQIAMVHHEHGIGLFASRFDTQGVSLCESVASGCVVVTSNIPVLTNYINPELGVTCEVENPIAYANAIEKLCTDSEYYKKVSVSEYKSVMEHFGRSNTIEKELNIINSSITPKLNFDIPVNNPILTVIIPSYNVEKYLWQTVVSLINQKNANKIEVLIVNDGSKDKTKEIGEKLEKLTTLSNKSIVRIINKENGGHGSTINVGIKEARGKYVKVVDGDDTVDSLAFSKLIDILENENSDIVLNSYIEDYAVTNKLNYKEIYGFMKPGKQYFFDDLCYEGYGFYKWGPILSCSNYKTEMLRRADFKLTEHCFYVDMELNLNISLACKTVSFYPLFVYRYLLGRPNQSVTKNSYMKNYKNHETVIFNMIETLKANENKITTIRKSYIIRQLILIMIQTQYIVTIDFYNNGRPFREFEKRLKKYPEYYNNKMFKTRGIEFHRKTNGIFVRFNTFLIKLKNGIKKAIN